MGIVVDNAYTHRAAAAGLTEAMIRDVIDAFYAKVRRDPTLGPCSTASSRTTGPLISNGSSRSG